MDRPAASSALCETCRGLCNNGPGWCWTPQPKDSQDCAAVYIHHPSLHVLRAKAAEGCALCSLILRALVDSCRLELDTHDEHVKGARRETQDDVRRIVSAVQRAGVLLQTSASHRGAMLDRDVRTHTFRPAYEQERWQTLRSVCGAQRVLIRPRTLDPRYAGAKLPESLAVSWLGSTKTSISGYANELGRIRVLVDYDDPLGHLAQPGGVLPSSNLLSPTHLRRISHWRQKCSEYHNNCPSDEPTELPTRVIAVNSADPRYVKLVNTHRGRKAVYACLSYSWGTSSSTTTTGKQQHQHCTTTRNIHAHLKEIPVASLPPTVADAILLCRALQIPYIWIDALCIIQDDQNDWVREAGAMAAIYGSSALTISAPNAASSAEHFLSRNTTTTTTSSFDVGSGSRVHVDWTHAASGLVGTAILALQGVGGPSRPIGSDLLWNSPWMARGWTLQEWVLSPRILHCGSAVTVFQCLYATCYESHPDDDTDERWAESLAPNNDGVLLPEGPGHASTWPLSVTRTSFPSLSISNVRVLEADGLSRMFSRLVRTHRTHHSSSSLPPACNILLMPSPSWAEVIIEFCGRRLTKDADKLPAVAGLAVRFREYLNHRRSALSSTTTTQRRQYEYLAGLWWTPPTTSTNTEWKGKEEPETAYDNAELPLGLLWRRKEAVTALARPASYRAPSWSWAAVDGPVEFPRAFHTTPTLLHMEPRRLQIHEALCVYDAPAGSLAAVKAGWIDATGYMKRARLVRVRDGVEVSTAGEDEGGGGVEGAEGAGSSSRGEIWYARFDDRVCAAWWREVQRLEVFVLVVATRRSLSSLYAIHHALVLKRVAAEKACQLDCFARLGTALRNDAIIQAGEDSEPRDEVQDGRYGGWDYRKLRLL